jgi:hypothetical protein
LLCSTTCPSLGVNDSASLLPFDRFFIPNCRVLFCSAARVALTFSPLWAGISAFIGSVCYSFFFHRDEGLRILLLSNGFPLLF